MSLLIVAVFITLLTQSVVTGVLTSSGLAANSGGRAACKPVGPWVTIESHVLATQRGCTHSMLAARMRSASHRSELPLMTVADPLPKIVDSLPKRTKSQIHLMPGPIGLAWGGAGLTLLLQFLFSDWNQLEADAAFFTSIFTLPGMEPVTDPQLQQLAFYGYLYLMSVGFSFLMPAIIKPVQSEPDMNGDTAPVRVPYRTSERLMAQHKLTPVDYSYMVLNSLCMPGLFFHFITLMRSWGLDFSAPPMFGIYPENPLLLLTETAPELAKYLTLYFVTYEFIYYWWHRKMHEVPALYKWVHKHHHQQTYPDRAIIDTLNTGCVESQIGLYSQLGLLWAFGQLGLGSLAGGIWFFTMAGWMSVLEHDKYERHLPFKIFAAEDHHMHHAFVKCNYSPYGSLWDRVFGTFKPFEVRSKDKALRVEAFNNELGDDTLEKPLAGDERA